MALTVLLHLRSLEETSKSMHQLHRICERGVHAILDKLFEVLTSLLIR